MNQEQKQLNPAQKKKLLKMFFTAAAITMSVCIVVFGGAIWAYYGFIYDGKATAASSSSEEQKQLEAQNQKAIDINQTIAIFGTDKDQMRTDVIFVVNFNSKTKKAKILSIPRDTKVNWSDEQRANLKKYKNHDIYISKLNEMTAYGGMENIRDFTMNEIESMLGVKIDNYIIVNLEAFRKIVDTIGGVEVNVPRDMNYDDNAQDLHIHLKAGTQLLDGDKAEQLVRFRKYPNGDVDRIQVQQLFLKAFADKVMSPQMLTKVPEFMAILLSSLKTDINLTQIANYYPFIQSFDVTNLSFNTVPGQGRYENGISYFATDTTALAAMVEDVFFDTTVAGSEPPSESAAEASAQEEIVIDQAVTIEILNGTQTKGLAGRVKDALEKEGYIIDSIDNYKENNQDKTLIYAKDIKKAQQFKTFFKDAVIVTSTSIDKDIQIRFVNDYIQ